MTPLLFELGHQILEPTVTESGLTRELVKLVCYLERAKIEEDGNSYDFEVKAGTCARLLAIMILYMVLQTISREARFIIEGRNLAGRDRAECVL